MQEARRIVCVLRMYSLWRTWKRGRDEGRILAVLLLARGRGRAYLLQRLHISDHQPHPSSCRTRKTREKEQGKPTSSMPTRKTPKPIRQNPIISLRARRPTNQHIPLRQRAPKPIPNRKPLHRRRIQLTSRQQIRSGLSKQRLDTLREHERRRQGHRKTHPCGIPFP